MGNVKTGVLLINLGTPASADKKAVRRYLKEFLSDPRVVDLPWLLRQLLLRLLILPFRTKQSTHAYEKIWDPQRGSPLLFHSQQLAAAVQESVGEHFHIEVGMRYGEPSIAQAVNKLLMAQCQKILVFPLYPQYSSAATGSSIERTLKVLLPKIEFPYLMVRQHFYDDPLYIEAQGQVILPFVTRKKTEKVLFSYHSLPVRQIKKGQSICPQACFQHHPCSDITRDNALCYRAQCYKTSALLAQYLGLTQNSYAVAFQSRLGKAEWIGPDTQKIMQQFLQEGVERLVVSCPSFVADCLETLEEIGIHAKEQWFALGGKEFQLVPCLNDHPLWVRSVAQFVLSC